MPQEDNFIPNTEYADPNGEPYAVGTNGRINFAKISGHLELPYLVEIQKNSYDWFIQEGIDQVFREVFPIASFSNTLFIDYISSRLEEPKYTPQQCKAGDLTYSSKIKVSLGLRFKDSGEIKEAEVFMGDLPRMTASGTFVVNGSERVIVSQIVRSPGAYFQDTPDPSGAHIYNGEIIPARGTWLQFESDLKGVEYVRIDRQRKMPATILFKALGLDKEEQLKALFGDTETLALTLQKDSNMKNADQAIIDIFKKLKPGEPVTPEGVISFLVTKFFDEKRYDLGRAGRFKYAQKLGIYNRLVGRVLAEDLIDSHPEGGSVDDAGHIFDADGELFEPKLVFAKGHRLSKEDVDSLRDDEFFERGNCQMTLLANPKLDTHCNVNIVHVYAQDKEGNAIVPIVGNDLNLSIARVTISDMVACFSYFSNIQQGIEIGQTDDIDHLGNRRVRCVGELLQNQFRMGLTKMSKTVQQKMSISDMESMTPQSLVNTRPLTASIREFFASSQLSQLADQINPLSELTHKRRISALGPGGLTRDRASMEVRDVHYTHYGRICPIESPEGQNIGLINNLATYAKINQFGFIQTPYRNVIHLDGRAFVVEAVMENGKLAYKAEYLSADDEREHYIAEANILLGETFRLKDLFPDYAGDDLYVKEILDDPVVCRHDEDNLTAPKEKINYVDVSPKQIVSIAAASIPFLDHDDATRALMGANMQRQALPLLRPSIPYVGTGMEEVVAKDSGLAVVAEEDGEVESVDSKKIVIKSGKEKKTYVLTKFERSNDASCINQTPIVHKGDLVKKGQIIADGPAMKHGELALGQNILIAYMTWNGYNYEDAVIMSERMVKEDTFTSIHIEKYEVECRQTKLGPEEITRDIPNVAEEAKAFLDEHGIIVKGAEVKEGDILVGKVTPKGQDEPTPEEKLLMAIFAEKTKEGKDSSLRVPHGGAGIVHDVKVFSRKNKDPIPTPGVDMVVRIYIVQKRKISEGDKMSGRHGNKGVISKILPVEDMPFLADGTPIDILLSPMGVPSRMNIGQVLEIHLGLACRKLKMRVATPAFDGISNEELLELMRKAGISEDGKTVLYDGRTGEPFAERISVGVQYMIKLNHMVSDKLHARAVGPYSLVTQQPLGGKAQKGGQRFGEMEVWALEAYGAAHTLQEMLTIKSDDRVGRRKAYEAIIKGNPIPKPGMPEAFKVFTKELKGLCLNVTLFDKGGNVINLDELAKQAMIEERKTNSAIRSAMSPKEEPVEEPVDEAISEEIEAGGYSVRTADPKMDD